MKKHLLYSVFFAFLLGMNVFAQEIILPDQVFTITVTEKNANGSIQNMPPDELTLKANKINTKFSIKNGFTVVPYSVAQQGAPNSHLLDFTAESTSSNKDILKWSGTINGNSVSGKAQRIRNGKLAGEYTFTGTRKKKK